MAPPVRNIRVQPALCNRRHNQLSSAVPPQKGPGCPHTRHLPQSPISNFILPAFRTAYRPSHSRLPRRIVSSAQRFHSWPGDTLINAGLSPASTGESLKIDFHRIQPGWQPGSGSSKLFVLPKLMKEVRPATRFQLRERGLGRASHRRWKLRGGRTSRISRPLFLFLRP